MLETFQQHLHVTPEQLEALLSLPLNECLDSPEIQQTLNSLDINLLKESLPTAGGVLATKLPPFYNWLENELGVQRVPDSPEHTTKWVIGFVNNQESIGRLVELHRPVSRQALEASVRRLVSLFDGVEDARVRREWQRAIAALCLPLVVDSREREKSLSAVV